MKFKLSKTRRNILITLLLAVIAIGTIAMSGSRIPNSVCAQLPCELRKDLCIPCPVQVDPTVKESTTQE